MAGGPARRACAAGSGLSLQEHFQHFVRKLRFHSPQVVEWGQRQELLPRASAAIACSFKATLSARRFSQRAATSRAGSATKGSPDTGPAGFRKSAAPSKPTPAARPVSRTSCCIEEAGLGASRAVQIAGYALAVASLLLCSFAFWHLGRRLLAHMSHRNTTLIQLVDNEAISYAGSRSGRTHRVWVDLRLCAAACGCRAYLTEGVCGHADSALAAAKAASLCGSSATAGRTSVASQEDAASLRSRAALRGRDALRDIADPSPCFQGLAAKSRSITEGGCFSGLRGRNRDPPPAIQDAQAAVPDGTPLQAGRRNRSVPRRVLSQKFSTENDT